MALTLPFFIGVKRPKLINYNLSGENRDVHKDKGNLTGYRDLCRTVGE